jgi:hypothetical protein
VLAAAGATTPLTAPIATDTATIATANRGRVRQREEFKKGRIATSRELGAHRPADMRGAWIVEVYLCEAWSSSATVWLPRGDRAGQDGYNRSTRRATLWGPPGAGSSPLW